MSIKTGNIVSHAGALEWGAGKVLDVTSSMATIHFSDGKNRKIASSHFTVLKPADAASYMPPAVPAPEMKAARTSRPAKKKI